MPSWIRIDEAVVRSPSGREIRLPLPTGRGQYAAVARRADLDAALVDLAVASGADVRLGHGCTAVRQTAERVEIDLAAGGSITSDLLIAADGMWSPTRKMLGTNQPGYLGDWHAFRQYVRNVSPRAQRDLMVWFEPDLLPGYAWSFPLGDGAANVGFGVLRGGRVPVGDMKDIWPDLLQRRHIVEFLGPDAEAEAPHKAWPIPAHFGALPLTSTRTMWVGDAAAATDPMTGEGIGQALLTGVRAAEAIAATRGRPPGSTMAHYERAVRSDLEIDHRFAHLLSKVLVSEVGAKGAIKAAGLTDWTRRNFGRWLFEDYPRALVLSPRRWRRGAMTAPGTYRD